MNQKEQIISLKNAGKSRTEISLIMNVQYQRVCRYLWSLEQSEIKEVGEYSKLKSDYAALRARNERMERALTSAYGTLIGGTSKDLADTLNILNKALCENQSKSKGQDDEPDYPKLTPEQIQQRKEAIEWIRNPAGEMRWVRASERLPVDKKRNYIFRQAGNTRSARTIYLDFCPNIPALMQLPIENIEWLDEGKEVDNA